MKKFFYMAVAAIAALSSCSQDEVFQNKVNEVPEGSFIATIEQPSGTRTTLGDDGLTVQWENGDLVNINGVDYKATVNSSDPTKATLSPAGSDEAPGDSYFALYPSSYASDNDMLVCELPEVQTYKAGSISNLPMLALSRTTSFEFHNICSVLAVKVTNEQVKTVKRITVNADQPLSGDYWDVDNGDYEIYTDDSNFRNDVILDCGEGVTTNAEGTTFYIALPPNTYQNLTITVNDGSNDYKMSSTKTDGMKMDRNTIYPVTFKAKDSTPQYLCLTAIEGGEVYILSSMETTPNFMYSTDGEHFDNEWPEVGDCWDDDHKGYEFHLNTGQSLYLKGDNSTLSAGTEERTQFAFSEGSSFTVSGNIMSLLNGDNPGCALTDDNKNAFAFLFYNCEQIKSAKDLVLPSTYSEGCFWAMFSGCTNLTKAPVIPNAYVLAPYCFDAMFEGCTSLKEAPALPFTKLSTSCYYGMFEGCSALETAPVLPATSLVEQCYSKMFEGCSKLTSVTMKATVVWAEGCLDSWLEGAGAPDASPEVHVAVDTDDDNTVYNTIKAKTPSYFKIQKISE